jgi:hypothetical protein
MNLFHYVSTNDVDDGNQTLSELCADFNTVVWPIFQVPLCDGYNAVKIDAQWVHPIRYRVYTIDADPTHGAVATEVYPTGVAAVIRRFGEQANRHNQGRIFVTGLPITAVSNSSLTTGFQTTNKALWENTMVTVLHDAVMNEYLPIIWSGQTPTERIPVVGAYLDPIVRYQRRRELGVGQ